MMETQRRNSTGGLRAALVVALFAATMVVMPSVAGAVGPPVFINEIHYDNAGGDTGEAIEVAGPAGTNLAGWSIVLYNGSGGAVYGTINLSGTIPNQEAGFGTLSFSQAGIQNGSPDGLALVDAGSTVIEFLSYEGTYAAVGGPANGMTSTNIGVSEPSSTPVGESLQLTGAGSMGGDSTAAAGAHTFGEVNVGQSFTPPPPPPSPTPGDLVVNEVDYDQPSTDAAEFLEIKNTTAGSIDLTGVEVVLVNGTGGRRSTTRLPFPRLRSPRVTTSSLYANAATVVNCDLDDGPNTNFIQNGAPDAVAVVLGSTVIDTVSVEGDTGFPYTEGSGSGLARHDGGDTDAGISRCDDGVDTDQNNVDLVGSRPITPGATNDCEIPPPTIEFIHDIQGSGSSVAITGPVEVEGIVTEPVRATTTCSTASSSRRRTPTPTPIRQRRRASSSSAVATVPLRRRVGDLVTVTGEAEEFFGMSQIDMASGSAAVVVSSGNPLPTPCRGRPAGDGSTVAEATFENVEGMLVTFPDTLVVSEYFQLARFGQIVLTESSRPFQFTHDNAPSMAGYAAFLDDLATRRIILDDDNNDKNDAISDGPRRGLLLPGGRPVGRQPVPRRRHDHRPDRRDALELRRISPVPTRGESGRSRRSTTTPSRRRILNRPPRTTSADR